MKRLHHKKLSGAEGRKRKKEQDEEAKKSSKVMTAFLQKGKDPGTSKSVEDNNNPTPSTSTSSTNAPHYQEEDQTSSGEEQKHCEEQNYVDKLVTAQTSKQEISVQLHVNTPSGPGVLQHNELGEIIKKTVPDVIEQKDVGYLRFDTSGKAAVSDKLRTEMLMRGSGFFQNSSGPFAVKNKRSMTTAWFKRCLGKGKGEVVVRSWLVYSPIKSAVFCFSCLLFPSTETSSHCSSLELEGGFSSWKKPEKICAHENSQRHRDSFTRWKEMERCLVRSEGLIDKHLQDQIATEKEKWRQVLKRVLHCIKYLSKQNLPLRGHRETIACTETDDKNIGNFRGLLKLIAEFDPVMKSHLDYVCQNPGSPSYLSAEVQNEFIQIIASTVRNNLLNDIRRSKYYGIMFDSTPDAAHREQMSEIIRHVEINFEEKTVDVKESFLGFIQVHQKDAESTVNTIMQQLNTDSLPFEDCRSQCYDNATVMSGHKSGVQQRLATVNPKAIYVNCDNHSLNLAGVHAASHEVVMVTFFGTVQAVYVFFSRSTYRWERLKKNLHITVKAESETRWSARADAVRPIYENVGDLVQLLDTIASDMNETTDTRSEATQLQTRILSFDFFTALSFWNTLLTKIDRVQKRLQDPKMNFHEAAKDIQALQLYFLDNREEICQTSIKKAKELCDAWDVRIERRRRVKKKMAGETGDDSGLSAENEMQRLLKGTIDRMHTEMGERFIRLRNLDSKFGFLLDTKELLTTSNEADIKERCIDVANFYDTDLDGLELFSEIVDCRMLLKTRVDVTITTPQELLCFIVQYGDESVFPNLRVGLQILLTIAVSIASCERSFSKLKLILSYLRTSMGQKRLSALTLLSVEQEATNKINFDEIIDQFAAAKARKIKL